MSQCVELLLDDGTQPVSPPGPRELQGGKSGQRKSGPPMSKAGAKVSLAEPDDAFNRLMEKRSERSRPSAGAKARLAGTDEIIRDDGSRLLYTVEQEAPKRPGDALELGLNEDHSLNAARDAFDSWLLAAAPGEVHEYQRGKNLAGTLGHGTERGLAAYIWNASAEGRVFLFQKRVSEGFAYLAIRASENAPAKLFPSAWRLRK